MTQALDQQLDALKAAAEVQTQTYQSSRQQLYEAFVDAYLWWRDASATPKYFDAKLKEAGITVRNSNNNSPNFFGLIRLVWNIDTSRRSGAVSNWAQSMACLHDTFIEKPDNFRMEPRKKLLNFIHAQGGLGGLRSEKVAAQEDLDEQGRKSTKSSKAAASKAIFEQRKAVVRQVNPLTTINDYSNAVTDSDGMIVMLGRRGKSGAIEIVGSDYSEIAVSSALKHCANMDRNAVPPILRLIAESLEPHALPSKLEKQRKKYFQSSAIERKDANGKTQLVKVNTTLRIRPQYNDILVSKSPASVSVVSQIKPKQDFNFTTEVTLNGKDRQWIEADLLGQEKLTLYTAQPENALALDTSQRAADYNVELTNTQSSKQRRLYFYDVNKLTDLRAVQQPFVSNVDQIQYDWSIEVNKQWLAEFDAQCMTPWIKKIGANHNKPANQTVMLELTDAAMLLHEWWDSDDKKYLRSHPLSTDDVVSTNITGTNTFICTAKDFIPFFSALPNLNYSSDTVLISANSNMMGISYETPIAEVQHFIPAADNTGVQNAASFNNTVDNLEAE